MKHAIITGASGSIGGAIAQKLAKAGYSLVLVGNHSKDLLEKHAGQCQKNKLYSEQIFHTQTGDLGNPADASKIMAEALSFLGEIDLLVNCAGRSHIGLLQDMTDSEWTDILQTNLSSVFYCCRSVIPAMLKRKKGYIINISSVWGDKGASCEVAYSAAKGGVNAFTKALAKELAPSGITVNAIACGMIDTPMNDCFSKSEIQDICEEIPMGRMGTSEEIADFVCRIADSSYMTGQIITMDGGWC
jgi:3-oxoacyl-[acyl-carrier protein] reductase